MVIQDKKFVNIRGVKSLGEIPQVNKKVDPVAILSALFSGDSLSCGAALVVMSCGVFCRCKMVWFHTASGGALEGCIVHHFWYCVGECPCFFADLSHPHTSLLPGCIEQLLS